MQKMRIALLCGGPSAERGISLNSARSVLDNLKTANHDIAVVYFDLNKKPYVISPFQLYSNTPADFDYKIASRSMVLTDEELEKYLQAVDIVWPVMHGVFGEDGEIQQWLVDRGIAYIGSGPLACRNTNKKSVCQDILKKAGFVTLGTWLVTRESDVQDISFTDDANAYVVKPEHGGSSIGVEFANDVTEMKQALKKVWRLDDQAVIEPLCRGREFTVLVLENLAHEAVALLPTEIVFHTKDKAFDYRKKYLANTAVRYATPASFSKNIINKIREEAEDVFRLFSMRDVARLDGWLLSDGSIWWSDINAMSGLEQNSFLFQQAAILGMDHRRVCEYIIEHALARNNIIDEVRSSGEEPAQNLITKKKIAVLFGGDTAERQVSVLSGTNVWLKLRQSEQYEPVPILVDHDSQMWEVPYFICLHHTVEEMEELIEKFSPEFLMSLDQSILPIRDRLGLGDDGVNLFVSRKTSLEKIIDDFSFVFIGLHGGSGENGDVQTVLEKAKMPFNGPSAQCSKLCMDKFETAKVINDANIPSVRGLPKMIISLTDIPSWDEIVTVLGTTDLICKPRADGCSAGVARIQSKQELGSYLRHLKEDKGLLPGGILQAHTAPIELPSILLEEVICEPFVVTDEMVIDGMNLVRHKTSGWIEITVAVMGDEDDLRVLTPSQTVAINKVLSLEEKFQGGTGVNLTPPPSSYLANDILKIVRERIRQTALVLGIDAYARIDAFVHCETGELIIIEANTLPGLAPSTVTWHQTLLEKPALTPRLFLEKVIELGMKRIATKKI